jgi:hypothetical protein
MDPENSNRQELFLEVRTSLINFGYKLIYVDEASFNPQGISTYTWQKKGSKTRLIRSAERLTNVIAAWINKGKYAFMLKKSST